MKLDEGGGVTELEEGGEGSECAAGAYGRRQLRRFGMLPKRHTELEEV